MELIKNIGCLDKKHSYGEFLCSFCFKIVKKRLDVGKLAKSCGCVQYKLSSKSKTGQKRTDKQKQNISKSLKGKSKSNKHKQNISKSAKERFKNPENHPMYGKHHTEETRQIMSDNNKGKILSEEIKQKIRYSEIGKIVSEETRQKQSKARIGKYFGENSPNWQGGVSFEEYPQEFNKELKQSILKRDNYICQCPDCEHKSSKLDIHHIDYNKKNNIQENLISLCKSCHMKTNFKNNRLFWTEFYQDIIYQKYLSHS